MWTTKCLYVGGIYNLFLFFHTFCPPFVSGSLYLVFWPFASLATFHVCGDLSRGAEGEGGCRCNFELDVYSLFTRQYECEG